MPTLAPGRMGVPRWRTMIVPALIRWPPNLFTPRRLDWLSRPLRAAPPFCAMTYSFAFFGFAAGLALAGALAFSAAFLGATAGFWTFLSAGAALGAGFAAGFFGATGALG